MKKKTLEFNLAELNDHKLTSMLTDNNAGIPEVMALLEGLFDMWASALRFSHTAVSYGETLHPEFMDIFITRASHSHGVSPEQLKKILNMLGRGKTSTPSSSELH
jgi:hypothetical protein